MLFYANIIYFPKSVTFVLLSAHP
uniref:Uncharacterized protein n=1 Tax=Triticum urartu TaxID=4572 RepID=A0A8R7UQ39_TRIUA